MAAAALHTAGDSHNRTVGPEFSRQLLSLVLPVLAEQLCTTHSRTMTLKRLLLFNNLQLLSLLHLSLLLQLPLPLSLLQLQFLNNILSSNIHNNNIRSNNILNSNIHSSSILNNLMTLTPTINNTIQINSTTLLQLEPMDQVSYHKLRQSLQLMESCLRSCQLKESCHRSFQLNLLHQLQSAQ